MPRTFRRSAAALLFVSTLMGATSASAEPWRPGKAAELPDWLTVSGSYRVRYESLNNAYRAGATGSDQILVERLLLNAEADFDSFYFGAELQDSRSQIDDSGTPLGTDDVNTFELLRAYVGARFDGVFDESDKLDIQAGRMTMDVGSRRLVARNRFRNTLNAFTGIQGWWNSANGWAVQSFVTMPVTRLPSARAELDDNDTEFDEEASRTVFWGVDVSRPDLFGKMNGEAYVFGLDEEDEPSNATRNRRLVTPGFRLFSKPAPGAWDFEVEAAGQFGTSRATTAAADTTDLDHVAVFIHVEAGRSFTARWSPRLVFQYDYASGDDDPADGENNRFDTLYGARRFDFGPTGIYGALARSNINSPGIRVEAKPAASLDGFVGYRAIWLASDRDALTTGGVRDATGASGGFVGHQIETRVRYTVLPGNLVLEAGGAYLFEGEFLKNAPNAARQGDTSYVYLQTTLTF